MKHIILTRNNFMKYAFINLLKQHHSERRICIVDIDSFYTFSELLDAIEDAQLKIDHDIYFMQGISIHSKVLRPITAFDRSDCISNIIRKIELKNRVDWLDIKRHLLMMLELSMMSRKEKEIVWAVALHPNISTMANLLNSKDKTIYSRLAVIVKKLNLKNLNDLRRLVLLELNYTYNDQ